MSDWNPAPAPKNNWLVLGVIVAVGVAVVWLLSQVA